VQGAHSVKERPSFKEPAQRNAKWERSIYFQEILRFVLSKSEERKVCMGNRNTLRKNIRRDNSFLKCWRDPIVRLIEGTKVQNLWRMINILNRKEIKILGGGATMIAGS
jgi:hypothetical protein